MKTMRSFHNVPTAHRKPACYLLPHTYLRASALRMVESYKGAYPGD